MRALAFLIIVAAMPTWAVAAETLSPILYQHPGLKVDLSVGLWAFPVAFDHDNDGDLDLIVGCPDKPQNGVWIFENPGPKGEKHPVFKPPRKWGGPAPNYLTLSWVNGQPRMLGSQREYPNFQQGDWATKRDLYPRDRVAPIKYLRSNTWHIVDYNGDGKHDLIVGHDSWDNFGSFDTNDWWKKYDARGVWHGGKLRGQVFWLKNDGTDNEPKYAQPVPIMAGSTSVETYGAPTPQFADYDGDGDLDLLCGEFLDGFTYYHNIGSRTEPKYADGVKLPVTMDLQMVVPHAVDWDGDGDIDLLVGDEDGRVALLEHSGDIREGVPVFLPPFYLQQEADQIDAGALATPIGCDWDGDGDEDIVCGNTAGHILFFENLSGPKVAEPKWAAAVKLTVNDEPFRIMAGPNGSIQGPAEAKWGYTTQSVADWDMDGDLDIVLNSIWGRVMWLKNIGNKTRPKLAQPELIQVDWPTTPPKPAWTWFTPTIGELTTQWRTTPVITDWNNDGRPDLVMLDHEGFLTFWERQPMSAGGFLLPPKRVLLDKDGQPLRFNPGLGGRSGRRKLCVFDWDGDGKLDILANSQNSAFHRQIEKTRAGWLFAAPVNVSDRNIEGHDTSPTTVDWDGNGIHDLLIGAEDGRLYFLRNPRSAAQQ